MFGIKNGELKLLSILFLAVILGGCNSTESVNNNPVAEGVKVLFIGNSLTFYNDVPGTFANFCSLSGKQVFVGKSLIGGASLQDHSLSVQTTDLIFQYQWDYVVIQGGSYTAAYPEYFHEAYQPALLLKNFIKANNSDTDIIFFMGFSAADSVEAIFSGIGYNEMQNLIDSGAHLMADSLGFMIAPVGAAWRTVYNNRPDIMLYDYDGIHPSPAGSYLEASVYYGTIFRESCVGLNYLGGLSTENANYLQQIGSNTVLNNLELWHLPSISNHLY